MNIKKCYIVGDGDDYGIDFIASNSDFVIAADAGMKKLKEKRIRPNLLIGDFDSLGIEPDASESTKIIKLPVEKDDTDMLAAVKEGIKEGCTEYHLYGGMGGRIDHTYANIQILSFLAEHGMAGYLYGKDSIMTVTKNSYIEFSKEYSGYISIFAFTDKAVGVSIRGLKYEVENIELTNSFPLGVSNEFVGKDSRIEVKKGRLLIIFPRYFK